MEASMTKLNVGDTVILKEHGSDYGKMCLVIDISENSELPVRVSLINPHDAFREGYNYLFGVTERWMHPRDLALAERQ